MRRVSTLLWVAAVAWQVLFLYSFVDVYLRSPLVHGAHPISCVEEGPPPAQRLVFFVSDGLKADTLFDEEVDTPFLRSVLEEQGAFGLSYAHLPTETRPCHVSLLAGIYEDNSAIMEFWRRNPVWFDSLFNHTSHAFVLGSDIVPMFGEGIPADRLTMLTYDRAAERAMAADATVSLNEWVFDHWTDNILANESLTSQLDMPKSIHFLHLLSTDVTGHAFRPSSPEYIRSVKSLDRQLERMWQEMERRFPDGRTAYVLTSDHGMSHLGQHGQSQLSVRRTPLVAWGSGIRKPQEFDGTNPSPGSWQVEHLHRANDIQQADVAPLLAGLLGVPIPVNNVGRIPLDYFLNPRSKLLLCNAAQVLELVRRKHELASRYSLLLRRWPDYDEALRLYRRAEASHSESKIAEIANRTFYLALEGVQYYSHAQRLFLYPILSIACLGYGATIWSWIDSKNHGHHHQRVSGFKSAAMLGAAWLGIWWYSSPLSYYAYVFFALFWPMEAWHGPFRLSAFHVVGSVVCMELIGAGFLWRWTNGVLIVVLAAIAGLKWKEFSFSGVLILSAVFSLIPADYYYALPVQPLWVGLGGFAAGGLMVYCSAQHWQVALVAAATFNSGFLSYAPLSWMILAMCTLLYLAAPHPSMLNEPMAYGIHTFGIFAPVYVLLASSFEALFLVVLAVVLALWIKAETNLRRFPDRGNTVTMRSVIIVLSLVSLSYFGAGHTGRFIYDQSGTTKFFSIFSKGSGRDVLVAVKIAIPGLLVRCAFSVLRKKFQIPLQEVLASSLCLANILSLTAFFLMSDEGSWKDIGTKIVHFIIPNVAAVGFLLGDAVIATMGRLAFWRVREDRGQHLL
jgi:phosphatidylinositol glycan class N